jgi:hypothetical protein
LFKLCPSKTKVGFKKNYQVGKKWMFDDYSYLCKGLLIPFLQDMGKLMGLLKGQLAGKADMGVVSKLIKSKLS